MRELAEDVGDDRVLDQLASGAQPEAAALVGRFSPRTRVVEGDVVEVSVRPAGAALLRSARRGSRSETTQTRGEDGRGSSPALE